jgi:hypothetical protein
MGLDQVDSLRHVLKAARPSNRSPAAFGGL